MATLGFTQLKTMLTIGGLWRTGVHRTRSIALIPFHDFFRVRGFFNPLFNTMGNLTLFVPLGILLGVWWVMHGRWSSTAKFQVTPDGMATEVPTDDANDDDVAKAKAAKVTALDAAKQARAKQQNGAIDSIDIEDDSNPVSWKVEFDDPNGVTVAQELIPAQ